MPAPAVDPATKEAIKAAVIRDGVTPTARAFNLPVGTVKAWSAREKWLQPFTQPQPAMAQPATLAPKHTATVATASAAALSIREQQDAKAHANGRAYVGNQLKYAARVSRRDPESGMAIADKVKAVASTGQVLNMGGFERQADRSSAGLVNIAILGVDPASVQINTQSSTNSSTEAIDG